MDLVDLGVNPKDLTRAGLDRIRGAVDNVDAAQKLTYLSLLRFHQLNAVFANHSDNLKASQLSASITHCPSNS